MERLRELNAQTGRLLTLCSVTVAAFGFVGFSGFFKGLLERHRDARDFRSWWSTDIEIWSLGVVFFCVGLTVLGAMLALQNVMPEEETGDTQPLVVKKYRYCTFAARCFSGAVIGLAVAGLAWLVDPAGIDQVKPPPTPQAGDWLSGVLGVVFLACVLRGPRYLWGRIPKHGAASNTSSASSTSADDNQDVANNC